jgi:hypothetical protein
VRLRRVESLGVPERPGVLEVAVMVGTSWLMAVAAEVTVMHAMNVQYLVSYGHHG